MSKQIDERVVSMRFDNAQFEKNVSTSMSTLDKLKNSLKLDGASKGLENVNTAAKRFDVSPLSNGIETIKSKFSALEVIGVTALANLSNSAVNTGKRLIASLSVDQLTAGWEKFGNKTGSVATLVAQGNDLEVVNKQLDRLNWFTDETSYNFTDMVSNIAKFTASGKGLEESVTAMEGIANWAALSGQNATTASNAMYQLSQAMGAGVMRMEDYKSIQNASMDTDEFRQKCLDAGVALGTLKKNADGTYKSLKADVKDGNFTKSQFAQHLTQDAWLTSDVMMKVFQDYSAAVDQIYEYSEEKGITASEAIAELGDKVDGFGLKAFKAAQEARTWGDAVDSVKDAVSTGWMNTFEIVFGNQEEATKLWTDLANAMYDVFAGGAESRNELLSGWKELGGRDALVESFWNAWDGIASIITPIKEAFRDIFPPMTAKRLAEITERIKELTGKFKELTEKNAPKLKSTFKGIFSIVKIGVTIVKSIISGITQLISKFTGISGGILGITGSLGEWIAKLSESITETNLFGKVINTVVGFLGKAVDKLKEFGSFVKGKFETSGFDTFLNILKTIWNAIKKVGIAVVKVITTIGQAIGKAFQNGDIKSLLDILNTGIFTGILLGLKKWINGFKSFTGEGKNFVASIKDILGSVGNALQSWQKSIKADILKKIAVSIGILAASLWVLSRIDSDKLGTALSGITALFIELIGAMKAFDALGIASKGAGKSATLMFGMSLAVLILASAMKKLSDLDWDDIGRGLVGVGALLLELVGAAKLMSIGGKNISKGATQMILMAAALKIMTSVCSDLSKLSWEELGKGIAGIGGILLIFAGFAELIKLIKPAKMISSALSLILIGAAMEIFADVCKKFGQMKWESLGKAGAAIAGILLIASGFGKLSSYAGKMMSSSVALILIGAAMEIFADVCNKFGQMEWEALGKAGAAIGGILVLAAGFTLLSGLSKKLISSVVSLTIIAASMEIFADVCNKFGQMEWEALGKAGAAIGGILALASGFMLLGNLAGSNMLKTAASLLIMAAALAVLTPILKSLGNMSWEQITKGLIAIAGAFAIIGVAGLLLGPIAPSILALSGAIALLGLGCLAAGVGIAAFAVGMGVLAGVTAAGATAIVTALHIIIVGILELIPSIIGALTDVVVALCEVFIRSIPAIGEAIRVFILEVVKILVECVPALADGALKMVVGVLQALVDYTPQIVNLVFDFLIAILNGIAQRLPELIQSFVNVLMALFSGVVDALNSMDPEMLVKGILGIGFMLTMMAALAGMAALAPAAMVGVLGFGAVITELAGVLAALGALSQIPGLEWLISEGGDFLQKVGTAIGQFIGGIVGGIAEGVTSTLPQVGTNLSNFMTNVKPFIEGAKTIDPSAMDGVKSLVGIILALTGANILEGLTSWFTGGSSLTKFGEEIAAFAPCIKSYADTVKGIDTSAVESSANAAKTLSELASNLPNSGGLVGWFAGENDIGDFGDQLVPFGEGIKKYADTVKGIDPESVKTSAEAAKSLAELADAIPNQGGVVAWFSGENSIASFGTEIVSFGESLKSFASSVTGINVESVTAAADAAKALAEMANYVPNEGGLVSWFTGDNSLASFGPQIADFGKNLKAFADSVVGVDPASVTAAAAAAKALAEMANTIPNEGGVVSWFAGDNSLASFGPQIASFGVHLKSFATNVAGIDPASVMAAAQAGMTLAGMANMIPNEGGVVSWFAGDNSLASFGPQIASFGLHLKAFATNVAGIDPESVSSAATAGKALAEMASTIPNEGGVIAWFTGDNSLANFGPQIASFGAYLKSFATNVAGIDGESVSVAAQAGKMLAEMASFVPNEGGITVWFTGEKSLASFGPQIASFGVHLKSFATNVAGIDGESVTVAAQAGKTLAEMASFVPNEGGIKAWFTGDNSLASFGPKIASFGLYLKLFSIHVAGINSEEVSAAAKAGKYLAEMANVVPNEGGIKAWFSGNNGLANFGPKIASFGLSMKQFSDNVKGINPTNITSAAQAGKALAEMTDTLPKKVKLTNFGEQLVKFGEKMKEFYKTVSEVKSMVLSKKVADFQKMVDSFNEMGEKSTDKFIKAFNDAKPKVTKAVEGLIKAALSSAKSGTSYNDFYDLGSNLVKGFSSGISKNTFRAEAAAKAMADSAYQAAKKELDINSPSKKFRRMAYSIPEGFAQGIERYGYIVKGSAVSMADTAINGTKKAISRIADVVNMDIDSQPTIRPVLDLTDIRSGMSSIDGMFASDPSIGVSANVRSISSMMNRNQNGTNSDVISAIKELGKTLDGNSGDTYNINGVTYSNDSDVADAVRVLTRAAKVERRK